MARRRLETPSLEHIASLEASLTSAIEQALAAKPASAERLGERLGSGLTPPIAQIVDDTARAASARDARDAQSWREAGAAGRIVTLLALEQIDETHMMRDRMVVIAEDLDELRQSIQTNGLRLPIEVLPMGPGRYGLISGWRRLAVYRQLLEEEGADWARIPALIRAPAEAPALYTAMVEENELRAQITPYERGRIAVMSAVLGAFPDTDTAISTIFATASKAKKSKIRSFAYVHEELGEMLQFGPDLSERNGLRLAHALRDGWGPKMRHALIRSLGGAAEEWALLEPILAAAEAAAAGDEKDRPSRGGRPRRTPRAEALGPRLALSGGLSMERIAHDDGYSIRLRGPQVEQELVDLLMDEMRRLVERILVTG